MILGPGGHQSIAGCSLTENYKDACSNLCFIDDKRFSLDGLIGYKKRLEIHYHKELFIANLEAYIDTDNQQQLLDFTLTKAGFQAILSYDIILGRPSSIPLTAKLFNLRFYLFKANFEKIKTKVNQVTPWIVFPNEVHHETY